jgi:hypothetical protein
VRRYILTATWATREMLMDDYSGLFTHS